MEISGLIKTSLIDYPGKVAAVIFTQGCNFRCGFCHNPDLIPVTQGKIEEGEVLEFLKNRVGKLDGVVVTGGEPTIQKDLPEFIKKIKELGYAVKLDSNGSNPNVLRSLITDQLIDYVAMDIKGLLENYEGICVYKNTEIIKENIKVIMQSGIDYEFRTTVLPYYHQISDFEIIGESVRGAKRYTIQGFRPEVTYDKKLKTADKFTKKEFEKISGIMKNYVDNVKIHQNI